MEELINKPQYIIVGAGLTGSILANKIAKELDAEIFLIEKDKHIGGRYYDYIDENSKLLISKYQHKPIYSDDKTILNFLNKYTVIKKFQYKILNLYNETKFYSPVNVSTINNACNKNIRDIDSLNEWIDKNISESVDISNTKQKAISLFGRDIFNNYLEPYLKKKWKRNINDLSFCVLNEFEFRKNQNDSAFKNKTVGFLKNGYCSFMQRLISNKNIKIMFETDFFEFKKKYNLQDTTIIYTGKIDDYFSDSNLNKLEYLNITNNNKTFNSPKFKQECSIINNLYDDTDYFSSIEYKQFSKSKNFKTLISYQTIDNSGDLIPIPSNYNLKLYEKYKKLAEKEKNVHFIGTLALYKNFSVAEIIKNALNLFEQKIKPKHRKQPKIKLKKNDDLKVIFLCRFNKNIDWIKKIADKKFINNIVIFNYGNLLQNLSHKKIKIRNKIDKNITIEKSYTNYIIENYNSLPKYIWFINENFINFNNNFENFFDLNIFNIYKSKKIFNLSSFNTEKNNIFDISGLKINSYLINKKDLKFSGHNFNLNLEYYDNPDNFSLDLLCKKFNINKPHFKKEIINNFFGSSLFFDSRIIYSYKKSFFQNIISILNENTNLKKYYKYIFSFLFSNISVNNMNEYYNRFIDISNNVVCFDNSENIISIYDKNQKKKLTLVENIDSIFISKKNKKINIIPYLTFKSNLNYKCVNFEQAKYFYNFPVWKNPLAIVIRGHIQNSFDNRLLKKFIRLILSIDKRISIFIHTWNKKYPKHKKYTQNPPISLDNIKNYFGKDIMKRIKKIFVCDETIEKVNGNLNGVINKYPIIFWKYMWLGKYKIIKYLYDNKYPITFNMRFDLFGSKNSWSKGINVRNLIKYLKNLFLSKNNKILLYSEKNINGISDLYYGPTDLLLKFIGNFFNNMDNIIIKHKINNREIIFYRELLLCNQETIEKKDSNDKKVNKRETEDEKQSVDKKQSGVKKNPENKKDEETESKKPTYNRLLRRRNRRSMLF